MAKKIKVIIADDKAVREIVLKLFDSDAEIAVIGEAGSTEETVQKAKIFKPDIILMNITLPGIDSFAAMEHLAVEAPHSSIILMSDHENANDMRRAMIAGAKNYLVKPFTSEELLIAVKQVYANMQRLGNSETTVPKQGKIVTVFSTKGGVGKTVLTINLALALTAKHAHKVAIADFDLQFGDVALCLNVSPKASVADMVTDIEHLDQKVLSRYMFPYNNDLDLLPAPFQPEQAEKITGEHAKKILQVLKKQYQYTVVDTGEVFNDITFSILDSSDLVLLVSSMDLPNIKNMKSCLATMDKLGYSKDKIKLVLNRANSGFGLSIDEIENSLGYKFVTALPSDSNVVLPSINKGVPFVSIHPESPIAREIFKLAQKIETDEIKASEKSTATVDEGVFSKIKNLFVKNSTV